MPLCIPKPMTALGCALALAITLIQVSDQRVEPDANPGEPRPGLVASELLSGPANEAVEALVVLDHVPATKSLAGEREQTVSTLQQFAQHSQRDVVRVVENQGGDVLSQLWIHNAVVVSGVPDVLLAASGVGGVARIIPNFEVTAPEPTEGRRDVATTTVDDRTWGVDRIRAHRVWRELGVDGSGVRVATLDTGVDHSHPDLAGKLVTDDPNDPSFPGGWIAFAGGGEPMPVEPLDTHGHGTHVAGTIHGSDTNDVAIGVAPGADMMHAMVLPGGVGDFANILAGMQWAVDPYDQRFQPAGEPADVVNMSLGEIGYVDEFIDPIRHLAAAGVLPVVAIGNNCGFGNTASPGNVYDALGVGATTPADDVADLSCGGTVSGDQWDDPPEEWPESYVKPDLSAPGVDVYSAIPGGSHAYRSGTSMATPHVAGAASLMRQVAPDLTRMDLLDTLADTAFFDDRHGPERPNPRFGHGRIDAYAAVTDLLPGSGVTGAVTDPAGAPVAGATVSAPDVDRESVTDRHGRYTLPLEAGTYELHASHFDYQPATEPDVQVTADELTTVDLQLTPARTGTVSGTARYAPSGHGVPGATIDVRDHPVEVVTDQDGAFQLELPEGTYQIAASAPRLRDSAQVQVTVAEGEVTEAELALRPAGPTEQVDVASDGTPANAAGTEPSISADGRFVAFASTASNLVPGATNGERDIYVHDRHTGVTERVSVASDGAESNGSSHRPSISGDGRFVVFDSTARNLVEQPGASDIQTYLHDRSTGETELVSQSTEGEPANDWSRDAAVGGDGRYVLFRSQATNLVPGGEQGHIYLRDRETGTTEVASVNSSGVPANSSSLDAGISDNGTQISFRSAATNLDDDIRNGLFDVFVHDRDDGRTSRVSLSTSGEEAEGGSNGQVVISGNGRVLGWDSRAHNLDEDVTNDAYDVFVHDRETRQTSRVSLSSDGQQSDQNSRNPALSGNGRYVAFDSTSDTLDEDITNNTSDVFVHDRVTGQTVRQSLTVDGTQADGASGQQDFDHDGRFLTFRSFASNLVEHRTSAHASVFVRDLVDPPDPRPQFAVWDLRIAEPVALSPGPVTVSARVTNVGDDDGVYPAQLRIDGRVEAREDTTLAPGETDELQWEVERAQLDTYDVQVGPLGASFRIRGPEVGLSASTVQGAGQEAAPMVGATVELVDSNGELRQAGTTDHDGELSFEAPAPDGRYTIVVRRAARGDHELTYLLARSLRVTEDMSVEFNPHTAGPGAADAESEPDLAALVDVNLDPVSEDHQAWVYLRHPLADPHAFGVTPGTVVTTVAGTDDEFAAVNVHTVAELERDAWVVSEVVDELAWHDPARYEYELGGPLHASIEAELVDDTTAEVAWSLADSAGHGVAELRRTGLRPFAGAANDVPSTLPLDQVPDMVGERAAEPTEVLLRLADPHGEPLHAGGVGWHEPDTRLDLAELVDEVEPGRYALALEADTDAYGGTIHATAAVHVSEPKAGDQVLLVLSETPAVEQLDGDRERVVQALRQAAEHSQDEVIDQIEADESQFGRARVINRFWLQNMLLVEVEQPAGGIDAMEMAEAVDGVERVVPNFDVSMIEPAEAGGSVSVVDDRTWGVDRIGAHRVHRELSLDGAGTRVATLDTGVDLGHPDLTDRMISDDPGDPAHPGGWLEFDAAGNPVASTPHDTADHGTHVSGTIHGGDSSGVQIGVAPGAGMMHGLVLPGGQGTFAQVVAGMQWALDPFDADGSPAGQGADVLNMSLGAPGLHQEMVIPTRNLRHAGVVPAISIGNDCGAGGTSSPGNVYEAVGVGATDVEDNVADFSCGGVVESGGWPAPPPEWPDTYVKPDLSAPGVDVRSSVPGGGYATFSGTSMAAPHVAGSAALMLQAGPDTSVDALFDRLADTAFFDGRHGPARPNGRFGYGRINAYQATLQLTVDSGVTGTVTDAVSGALVPDARVDNLDTGASVNTDDNGDYRMRLRPGSYDLAVEAFGYEPAVLDDVEVEEETFTTRDAALDRLPWGSLAGDVVVDESGHGVPGVAVEVAGTPLDVTTDADGRFHLPSVPQGEYEITASLDAMPNPDGQTVTINEGQTTKVTFTVAAPTTPVGLLGDRNGAIAEFLDGHSVPNEDIEWDADVTRYGAIVVNQPDDPGADTFQDFLSRTDTAGVGLIFHDTWSFRSNGIEMLHEHTGSPAEHDSDFSTSIDYLYYDVTAAHPVVEGFEIGGEVVLNQRSSGREHAWFDGYQDGGRQTVADAARDDLGMVGRGIGVQQRENNRHVLLSMHATGSVTTTTDWGTDGRRVFRNALDWVAADRDGGQPAMVPWNLAVTPQELLSGDTAEVSVDITNVGTATGDYEAVLRVDGEVEDTTVTTVAAGGTDTVTWSLSREDLGTYEVAVGSLRSTVRVRAPRIDLTARTLHGDEHDRAPMAGATVELVDDGRRIPVGTTDADGRLTFETTRADATYTLVVRRAAAADHERAYLLTQREHVDADRSIEVVPRTGVGELSASEDGHQVALVDLAADPPADASVVGDQSWVYLRHPLTGPHGFAFEPGRLATTVAQEPFEAVNVQVASHLARDWWTVSRVVDDLRWHDPVRYRYRFGGPPTPSLAAEFGDNTTFQVDWGVADGHAHPLQAIRKTPLRSFQPASVAVPETLPLENVAGMVTGQAPEAAEVILRLSDPEGAPIHAGGVSWGQWQLTRELADLTSHVVDGVYPLTLEIDTGILGGLTERAPLILDTEAPVLDWVSPREQDGFFQPSVTVAGAVTDEPAGVAEVLVNGERAQLDAAGAWRRELSLDPGENEITVTAIDELGNQTSQLRTVALLDYTTEWLVPQGVAPNVSVGLRFFDSDGHPTDVSSVTLQANAENGEQYGPFEMAWRGQHYRCRLRDLAPGDYDLVAKADVDGWAVRVEGPTITVRGP